VNIVLNYCLIFGIGPIPALGVVGAAIGTVVARFTEAAVLAGVSYARRYVFVGPAREYAWRITRFAPLMAVGTIFVLLPLTQLLPFVFNVNEQVLRNATLMIIVLCASYPSKAVNMSMIVGICRAGGDTVFSGVFDVVFMWTVSLPLAAAVSFFLQAPVWFIYACICTNEPLQMFVNLWRLRSGKWLHNVTV
jgi:Na+-driven multidrug efflux pump